jgi:glycerol-3-phosphate acyltransferase PlsX
MARSRLIDKIGDTMQRFPIKVVSETPEAEPEAKPA